MHDAPNAGLPRTSNPIMSYASNPITNLLLFKWVILQEHDVRLGPGTRAATAQILPR
jgi:hypothetical protein